MDCYTELIPPTAVTHAVALPFLGPDVDNLVVAKTSLLQIFNVVSLLPKDGEEEPRSKLVLIGEYPLMGTVTGIARVKTLDTKTGGEALLLSFSRAKLSLLEWDSDNHRPSTISIHFYEGENVIDQPFGPGLDDTNTILAVDPSSRCAALKFGARHLAILPFRQAGDDLIGEEEEGLDTLVPAVSKAAAQQNGDEHAAETPYKASFVLPLTALDPSLSNVVHFAFLHEYREPTFGILASPSATSSALSVERKDILTYTVFTLDLEQRASTNLITVPKLPSSLWKVIPLPLPIGGSLLIGANEFIHVDQSGKANATAVNEFAKLESDLGMADQSHLNMKLEDCVVEVIDESSGALLIVLNDGSLATLSFKVLRRSISELVVTRIATDDIKAYTRSSPSCLTGLSEGDVFIGSDCGPSALVSCIPLTSTAQSRKRAHNQINNGPAEDADGEEIEEDDDDLYAAAPDTKKRAIEHIGANDDGTPARFVFDTQDQLLSIGPVNQICLGRSGRSRQDKLELVAGSGRGQSSHFTVLNRDIVPELISDTALDGLTGAWAIRTRTDEQNDAEAGEPEGGYDNLLFVNNGTETKIYDIEDADTPEAQFSARSAPEFEEEGETIEVSLLRNGTRIAQCRRSEIRVYEADLTLSQIIPMVDEETDAEFNIIHTMTCDPFMLVIRDDSSVQVLQVQGKEIEPLEGEGVIAEKKWLSGSIYAGDITQQAPVLWLLDKDGAMHIFSLPDLQHIMVAPSLPHLSPVFSLDAAQRRMGVKETLTELLVTELGTEDVAQPYLVLRTAIDDIVLYEPFSTAKPGSSAPWHSGLRFRKVPLQYIPKYNEAIAEELELRPVALKSVRIGKYRAICIPGMPPSLLLKDTASMPNVLEIRQAEDSGKIQMLSPIHRATCPNGFMSIGPGGRLQQFCLPTDTWFGSGWSIQQIDLGIPEQEIRQLVFHADRGLYLVAACRYVDFFFAEDDNRHPEQDEIDLRPQVPQYTVYLVSAATRAVIDTYELPYLQCVTSLKVMPLEISENTHEQKLMVVIGSAALRGEDMPARGMITVLDVIDVVPEPDRAESGVKFHVFSVEETKGAITAVESFPGGLIGTAQGQKVMVRGLKDDGSCLPVAFLDAQCHAATIKTLPGRGLWLLGDAWKGLWFGGFTEEPYKITVLGKSRTDIEVVTAEFLPFDGQLYILIIDANTDLHVLQYDPENPKTISGMRLLHRSTFHLGHFPTSMTLIPSTLAPSAEQDAPMSNGDSQTPAPSLFHVLVTSESGNVSLLTPLDESAYRRLSALQTHLSSILEHTAGLNPRAYRAAGVEGDGGFGGRGVVDGSLVRRISELGSAKRSDVLGRAGAGDIWALRSDLEIVSGGGLAYL